MQSIMNAPKAELEKKQNKLIKEYENYKKMNLKLDLSRGKPSAEQLDFSNQLLNKMESYHTQSGIDARNYGILDGIPECKKLFAELLDLKPDQIIIGGNSSLNLMYDTMARLCLFGTRGEKPWKQYEWSGKRVKFICPVPGYDRHFTICDSFGIEMIPVPLSDSGPDMEIVESLASKDPLVKGIFCVPLHSNPQGVCYSDETVEALVSMKTAAKDFSIFWDNAYGIHHIYEEVSLRNIFTAAQKYGTENRIYYFFSTSKITFPGAGIAMIASSLENITEIKKSMSAQTIGHDKMNQLRHLQMFKNPQMVIDHMKLHANILRSKFDLVFRKLESEQLEFYSASWSHPKGGYFISFNTLPGCAKETVRLAKEAGVILTEAGSTFPYGLDPEDRNIRIAPSYPTIKELETAMEVFCLCVKLSSINKLLNETKLPC